MSILHQIKLHDFETHASISGPYGYPDFADRAMGLLTPWSFVPNKLLPYSDNMNYVQRVYNVILSLYDWWFRDWAMLERQNEIAHRYFAHLAGRNFNRDRKVSFTFEFHKFACRAWKTVATCCWLVSKCVAVSCKHSHQYIEAQATNAWHCLLWWCPY